MRTKRRDRIEDMHEEPALRRDASTADGPHMNAAQIDAFLARPLIARLATTHHDRPRVTPMWYRWDGTSLWMETSPTFPNARIIRRNSRAAVTIDESLGGLRLRAVIMRGPITIVDAPVEVVTEGVDAIYRRYLNAEELATAGRDMLTGGGHLLLRLDPTHTVTWDTTLPTAD